MSDLIKDVAIYKNLLEDKSKRRKKPVSLNYFPVSTFFFRVSMESKKAQNTTNLYG